MVVAAGLLLVNDAFLFESVVVPSSSMRPTILPNERIFLQKFPARAVRRFDVVVADPPALLGRRVAKRVVGLPGDRIRIDGTWRVLINGQPLAYSDEQDGHLRTEAGHHTVGTGEAVGPPSPTSFGRDELLLGADDYFLLGDNRGDSQDSRVFGPVGAAHLQGTLGTVWYSYDMRLHEWRPDRLLHGVQ